MSATAGRKGVVKVSTTAGGSSGYVVALGIKSASVELDGASIDVSTLGVDWAQKIAGLKDVKMTLSGDYEPADTTGQVAIRTAYVNASTLYVQYLVDGTTGFQLNGCIVTKFSVDSDVTKEVAVSIEIEGSGAPTFI